MKRLITLPIMLLFSTIIFAQERFEFKLEYSELYATYEFIGKISDYYPDNTLKREFVKSKYNTEWYKHKVSQLDTLWIDFNYFFEQYVPTTKSSLGSRALIEKNLMTSKTINEFKKKSFGVIPNEELVIFSNAIEAFIPIYNELIYQPNKESFESQLSTINSELSNNSVSDIFNVIVRFYGTKWDFDIPFKVIANPVVGNSGIGARASLNTAMVRFPLTFKSHEVLFSVMLHEISHIIYDNQSITLKNNLLSWFRKTNSKNSTYAFQLLNEVLATSLGNGYSYEYLSGKLDSEDWYYVKYVNLMAKEVYPLVKEYLKEGKTIDEEFVKSYVNIYDTKFPKWTMELDNILTYRVIFSDSRDNIRYFRRNYPYTHHRSGLITSSEIEEKKHLIITKVIVISSEHKEKLTLIRDSFDELKRIEFDSKREFVNVFELKDRTKLILISKHGSNLEELMNSEFNEGKIKTVHNNGYK